VGLVAGPEGARSVEASFNDTAKIDAERHGVEFARPPTAGALRQPASGPL
jgi:hypothetical protein